MSQAPRDAGGPTSPRGSGTEWLPRLAAATVNGLTRLGLRRLAFIAPARALGRLLGRRAGVRTIAGGLGKGLRIAVLPETPVWYWLGVHEPTTQEALRRLLSPGLPVYDCGANVGYFTAMCARLVAPNGGVYAFEPSPRSAACLRQVAELNGFAGIEVVPRAVWRETTVLEFASGPRRQCPGERSCHQRPPARRRAHHCGPAGNPDDFVFRQGHSLPDVVKLDVEGSESAALEGALRLLRERRPTLLLQVHGEAGRGAWEILRKMGYRCRDIASGAEPQTADEFAVWIRIYAATPVANPT